MEDYGNQSRNITATVTTATNQTTQLTVSNAAGQLSFFGFDATDPITSVTLSVALNPIYSVTRAPGYTTETFDSQGYGYYEYYNSTSYQYLDYSQLGVDNLMYGVQNLQAESGVPEPASWIFLLTLMSLVFRFSYKKRLIL